MLSEKPRWYVPRGSTLLLGGCAAASGGMLALCYAPFRATALVWLALVPLIAACLGLLRRHPVSLSLGMVLGGIAGFVFFLVSLFWLTEVTIPGWFTLAAYLAIYPAVWGGYLVGLGRVGGLEAAQSETWLHAGRNILFSLVASAGWVGLEWLRGVAFTGFGWNAIGVALYENIGLIQIADSTGVGGVSFLVVLVNCLIVLVAKRLLVELRQRGMRPHYDAIFGIGMVILVFTYGMHRVLEPGPAVKSLKVAAVQGNIPQDEKWDPAFEEQILKTYQRLTQTALWMKPQLLIWPEAATPQPALNDRGMFQFVSEVVEAHTGDFLFGSLHYEQAKSYNAALMLSAVQSPQLYFKNHLVPFGEYIPLRFTFPLFAWIAGTQVPEDFDAGDSLVVFTLRNGIRIGPLICFEDTLGELARGFIRQGAQMLVTMTNDGWFRKSAGSEQHMAHSVFRSVETRVPLVRAANTGVTCFVDPIGRITQTLASPEGDTFIDGVLFGTIAVPIHPPSTLYLRWGEWFSVLCLVIGVMAGTSMIFRNIFARRS